MSKGYTSNGKRIASMGHARHAWVCRQCRRLIRGNGGKSSHRAWHEKRGDRAHLVAAHMPEAKALLAEAAGEPTEDHP